MNEKLMKLEQCFDEVTIALIGIQLVSQIISPVSILHLGLILECYVIKFDRQYQAG